MNTAGGLLDAPARQAMFSRACKDSCRLGNGVSALRYAGIEMFLIKYQPVDKSEEKPMKFQRMLSILLALAFIPLMGCSSALKMFNDNPLTNSLMNQIPGLSQLQAVGGAGALLGLAQSKLPAIDFSKVSKLVANVDEMIKQATKSGLPVPSALKGFSDLASTFSKLGLSAEQSGKLVPATTKFFTEKGGAEVGNMLASAWK